ncbi:MAG: Hint domain-containing protein [Tabrizicola sp.]|jgi:hypothetical protein|nr:Hint domain-containing protein [Tabrizicola sp.]
MATYQFTIYTFSSVAGGPIRMVSGGTDLISNPGNTQGFQAIGETFEYTGGAGTTILVEDDDAFANDGNADPRPGGGGTAANGNQTLTNAASNPASWRGQPLQIEYKITVRINDPGGPDDGRIVEMYVVRIGPNTGPTAPLGNVGIVSTIPLDADVTYTVISVTDQETPASVRTYASANGANAVDATGVNAVGWDEIYCFTHGTLVDTPDGPRLIEDLQPGDLVTTMDNGSQPVRWIGSRVLTGDDLQRRPQFRPVLFETGAIGNTRPLLVSQQHRILLTDWRSQVYFGEEQVLIAAKAMVNGKTIRKVLPDTGVTYCHLLFDRHEILLAEGALSESFHPGEIGMGALDAEQRREIEALFPDLPLAARRSAYPIVRASEAQIMLSQS